MAQYRYAKRHFLNPLTSGHASFVYALAESSTEGSYPLGNYHLFLGDCYKIVTLEFSLASATLRKQSLAKADTLAQVVCDFRDALKAEATLIEKAEEADAEQREKQKQKKPTIRQRRRS